MDVQVELTWMADRHETVIDLVASDHHIVNRYLTYLVVDHQG